MTQLRESIAAKKDRLDRLRPLSPEAMRKLRRSLMASLGATLEHERLFAVRNTTRALSFE